MAKAKRATVETVLAEFLTEQRGRLADKTYRKYESVIQLLQHCLNSYGYEGLDKEGSKLFDDHFNASGPEHREFCQLFGPEHIVDNIGSFLSYFMIRKVMASKELLGAAGTVTKKLAVWLGQRGYVDKEDATEAAGCGSAAAKDLPQAEELAQRLRDYADMTAQGNERDEVEDHFTLTRVDRGKIWLEGPLGVGEVGPIKLPDDICSMCREGWTISGIIGRSGKQWRFVEAWNVYPR